MPAMRNRLLGKLALPISKQTFDEFVLECYAPDGESCRLMLEYAERSGDAWHVRFREGLDIHAGWNRHHIPNEAFGFDGATNGSVRITPDDDVQPRLIFTWLDFLKYKRMAAGDTVVLRSPTSVPAEKIKCVAWDLDNTLWRGILVEDGPEGIELREQAVDVVRRLDERGIIQTVVSKNNHDDAWRAIERLQLQDYFLYPAINWGPKSGNLQQIADKLNINVDSFALIDDSTFERAEVQDALPQVRVYAEDGLEELLLLPPFDVPVTETSRTRRISYLQIAARERIRENHDGDYDGFLRRCELEARLFVPESQAERRRCVELLQRTNQLNLSGRRYSAEEFDELLSVDSTLCVALDCRDRFGSYGIVGFASVDESGKEPVLKDFCLSCRVAEKRVEHALFFWLGVRAAQRGAPRLVVRFRRTDRNTPLLRVFDSLPFEMLEADGDVTVMALPAQSDDEAANTQIVSIDDQIAPISQALQDSTGAHENTRNAGDITLCPKRDGH